MKSFISDITHFRVYGWLEDNRQDWPKQIWPWKIWQDKFGNGKNGQRKTGHGKFGHFSRMGENWFLRELVFEHAKNVNIVHRPDIAILVLCKKI